MKELVIKDQTIQLDDEDYDRVSSFGKWTVAFRANNRSSVHCRKSIPGQGRVRYLLGLFILGLSETYVIEHKDGNPFNFQRENLIKVSARGCDPRDLIVIDGPIAIITNGSEKVAIIDAEDVGLVDKYRWYAQGGRGILAKCENGRQIKLSRTITSLDRNDVRVAVHINGDQSDCRRSNISVLENSAAAREYERKPNDVHIEGDIAYMQIVHQDTIRTVIIDAEKWLLVSSYGRWCGSGVENHIYVVGNDNKGKQVRLHRLIANISDDECVDHINGNTLDNRLSNLRVTDSAGNGQNINAESKGISGDLNVYWIKNWSKRPWLVLLRSKGEKLHWSRHQEKEDAFETASIARAMHYPTSKEGTSVLFNLAGFLEGSYVNGPGKRCVVWIGGCNRGCPKCFNPELWSFKEREMISPELLAEKIINSGSEGFTLSGGDPLDSPVSTYRLLQALHDDRGNLNPKLSRGVIMFTGFKLEELDTWQKKCIDLVDLVIDGRYVDSLRIHNRLAGSSNQRFTFSSKVGRGRELIGGDDVLTDQEVEIHASSDPKRLSVTGFPSVDRRYLKTLGLRVIG